MAVNYLSLLSTVVVSPGGTLLADGLVNLTSSNLSVYTDTFSRPLSYSTLSGSSIVAGTVSVSTLSGSSLVLNTLSPVSTVSMSTLSMFNGATEQVRLNASGVSWINGGNVGIGTTTPETTLDVAGITRTNQLQIATLTGPSGLISEGTNILNLGLNFRPWDTIVSSNLGAGFRIDGRNSIGTPLFQWLFRPGSTNNTGERIVASMDYLGRLSLGASDPVTMLETRSEDSIHATLTRTGAGDHYASGIQHSLISATGGFRGYYARAMGGSFGTIATSAQSQANGFYIIDVANAGVFASDTGGYNSQFVITPTRSWFNTSVGIGTTTPTTALQVNGVVKSNIPSWYGFLVSGTAITAGNVVTYNTKGFTEVNCTFNTSTGRMTATVAGRYYVFFTSFAESDGSNNTQVFLRKNGSNFQRNYNGSKTANSYGPSMSMFAIVDMAVNDYLDAYASIGSLHGNENCYFGGYMIG